MRRRFGVRPWSVVARIGWLLLVWLVLWGSVSVGTVVSGVLVAGALLAVFRLPPVHTGARVRPLAALRLLGFFLAELLRANAVVAWEAVSPRAKLRQAVVSVPVRGASDGLVTLVSNIISLTPGTLTLEVDRPAGLLYVHVLHLGDVEQMRRGVLHLERLTIQAFGSAEARAALAAEARAALAAEEGASS